MYAMAVRTVHKNYVGRRYGMLSLTRVGTCPICKKRVERSYTDIFFPYCGYTCKRVMQRKEEEKEKAKIVRQQKLIEDRQNRHREKREREAIRLAKELRIKEIQARIAQCESEYDKNFKEAERLPKKSEKRWRAKERAKNWYGKMVKAQTELDRLQKGEEELNDSGRQTDSYLN